MDTMSKPPGRQPSVSGSEAFQITLSRPAFAYLSLLARVSTLGSSPNTVAAAILTRELERMRLSGDYPKDIPVLDDGDVP